jgi:hypothetical protein
VLVKIAVAIKPEDLEFLKKLADETSFAMGYAAGDTPEFLRERVSLSHVARYVINVCRGDRAKRVKGGNGEWYYYVVGPRRDDGTAEVEFKHMVTGETRRAFVRIATELPTLPPPAKRRGAR